MTASTIITFVLDETGSMADIFDDTVNGFNDYVEVLQDQILGEAYFSCLKFDANHMSWLCEAEELMSVPKLGPDNYSPGSMTPLYDACMEGIRATEETVEEAFAPPRVIVVFQTDGFENASRRYRKDDLAAKIDEKKKLDWQFVFLGAGINAYDTTQDLGIDPKSTVSYGRNKSRDMFKTLAANTAHFAKGETENVSFSKEEKRKLGDTKFLEYHKD